MRDHEARPRLVELLASISLATDLGTGQPLGHGMRVCQLAVAIAGEMGCNQDEIRNVIHVALLRFLGCTADAPETARAFGGNEILVNSTMAPAFVGGKWEAMRAVASAVAPDAAWPQRSRLLFGVLTNPREPGVGLAAHCEVAAMLARRLGLGERVSTALRFAYERWDGKGYPEGVAGEDIPLEVRVCTVARDVDVLVNTGLDPEETLQRRRGRGYDPAVVDAWLAMPGPGLEADWDSLLALEPVPHEHILDLDAALTALADFVDLKSPWTRGHSRDVARLAGAAAEAGGLADDEVRSLRRAGLVHDLGRVGVENGVWDKAGPLSSDQWEKVRLHAYLTGRVLSRCPQLSDLVSVAACHHERVDGSGYHSGLGGDKLSFPDRILAAADVLAALVADRPHRRALEPGDAYELLSAEVDDGRLDAEAVRLVVTAHGGDPGKLAERTNPDGLTDREVEVLRHISAGLINREVADALIISPKTVGRHIENIYAKIGVGTRAGAAVYAMEHDLLR